MTVSNIVLEALGEAIKVIEEARLDYCLFGGLAMQAYKRIRSTMDVDLILAINEKEISGFIARLQGLGFRVDRKKIAVKIIGILEFFRSIYTGKNSQIDIFVDFVQVRGEFQKEILRRKRRLNINGLKVNVASCEDLILLKILSGRPLDKADAEALVAENIETIDKNYTRRQARKLRIERRIDYLLSRVANA